MTEAEWQSCTDPTVMLECLRSKVTDRKLRLFAVGCCRRIWPLLTNEQSRMAVDVGERFADSLVTDRELNRAYQDAQTASPRFPETYWTEEPHVEWAAVEAACPPPLDVDTASNCTFDASTGSDGEAIASLLRCIIGNPFCPVRFDPAWLSATVVAVAQAIYEERRFTDMPILADALEDSGCASMDILSHCRNPGEHVLGCWVVDAILGKK